MKKVNIGIIVLLGFSFALITSSCSRKDDQTNEQDQKTDSSGESGQSTLDPYLAYSKVLITYRKGNIDEAINMFIAVDWNSRASASSSSVVQLVRSVLDPNQKDNISSAGQNVLGEELVKNWVSIHADFVRAVRQHIRQYITEEKYSEAEKLGETLVKCGEDLSIEDYLPVLIRVAGVSTQQRAVEELINLYTKTSRQQDIGKAEERLSEIKERRREIDSQGPKGSIL